MYCVFTVAASAVGQQRCSGFPHQYQTVHKAGMFVYPFHRSGTQKPSPIPATGCKDLRWGLGTTETSELRNGTSLTTQPLATCILHVRSSITAQRQPVLTWVKARQRSSAQLLLRSGPHRADMMDEANPEKSEVSATSPRQTNWPAYLNLHLMFTG